MLKSAGMRGGGDIQEAAAGGAWWWKGHRALSGAGACVRADVWQEQGI